MDRLTAACIVVEVAERGSLTQTAARLEMSQGMVSRCLAAMEGWVGVRLLHRTTTRGASYAAWTGGSFTGIRCVGASRWPRTLACAQSASGRH